VVVDTASLRLGSGPGRSFDVVLTLVENPAGKNRGIAQAFLDGAPVDPRAIPLADDGALHRVQVVMGEPSNQGASALAASQR